MKSCLKNEFQKKMLGFRHEPLSDFYLSCFQKGSSPVPLMVYRSLLLCVSLFIFIYSLVFTSENDRSYWIIYMTNWGVCSLVLVTGLGVAVSARYYFGGTPEEQSTLPWLVKLYWIGCNVATPMAIFITIFYWSFLAGGEEEYAANWLLDVLIHAINSVVMLLLLLPSRQPYRFLHIWCPLGLSITYNVFSGIYLAAGGTDVNGNPWIYPMVNWAEPGWALLVLVFILILFSVIHTFLVGLTTCRDVITRSLREEKINDDKI